MLRRRYSHTGCGFGVEDGEVEHRDVLGGFDFGLREQLAC